MAETKKVGHIQFDVLIPENRYSSQLVTSLTTRSRLGFYLVASQKSSRTFRVTDESGKNYELESPGIIDGSAIISAKASQDQYTGNPALMVVLDSNAAEKMKQVTRQNLGHKMAVILMKQEFGEAKPGKRGQIRVLSVATIQGIFSKRFMITGLENEEAKRLETYLLAGGLATPLHVVHAK